MILSYQLLFRQFLLERRMPIFFVVSCTRSNPSANQ